MATTLTELVAPNRTLGGTRNPLIEHNAFSHVGSNGILEPQPAELHFSKGFAVGKRMSATLRLLNVSASPQRFHVIAPENKQFHVSYTSRQLVPGDSLRLKVTFTPTSWDYVVTQLRVHCDGSNLLIPIHAYPSMTQIKFPSRIDFGTCCINESRSRTITLASDVPLPFEFALDWISPDDSFSVSQSSGTIAAHSVLHIDVCYYPNSLVTSTAVLQLTIAQFKGKPLQCKVSGSAVPGLGVAKSLGTAASGPSALDPGPARRRITLGAESLLQQRSRRGSGVQAPRRRWSSIGGGDATPHTAGHDATRSKTPSYQVVDGHKVPEKLYGHHAAMFVLSAQAGRMTIAEMKESVAARRISRGTGADIGVDDQLAEDELMLEDIDNKQTREAAFQLLLRNADQFERSKDTKWFTCRGKPIPGQEEYDAIRAVRANAVEREEQQVLDRDRARSKTERDTERVCVPVQRGPGDVAAEDDSEYQPSFDVIRNNLWARRQAALSRFRNAARRVILSRRLLQRLAVLQRLVSKSGGVLRDFEILVDAEHRARMQQQQQQQQQQQHQQQPSAQHVALSQGTGSDVIARDATEASYSSGLSSERVIVGTLLTSRSIGRTIPTPSASADLPPRRIPLAPMTMKTPLAFQRFGHQAQPMTPLQSYLAAATPAMRSGAAHEDVFRETPIEAVGPLPTMDAFRINVAALASDTEPMRALVQTPGLTTMVSSRTALQMLWPVAVRSLPRLEPSATSDPTHPLRADAVALAEVEALLDPAQATALVAEQPPLTLSAYWRSTRHASVLPPARQLRGPDPADLIDDEAKIGDEDVEAGIRPLSLEQVRAKHKLAAADSTRVASTAHADALHKLTTALRQHRRQDAAGDVDKATAAALAKITDSALRRFVRHPEPS